VLLNERVSLDALHGEDAEVEKVEMIDAEEV
jgi:hypothetical protein